jgi:hypothetical protein
MNKAEQKFRSYFASDAEYAAFRRTHCVEVSYTGREENPLAIQELGWGSYSSVRVEHDDGEHAEHYWFSYDNKPASVTHLERDGIGHGTNDVEYRIIYCYGEGVPEKEICLHYDGTMTTEDILRHWDNSSIESTLPALQ